MRSLIFVLAGFFCVSWASVEPKDWWETAIFYQIYPRSFKDSNNDGIGDLNGVIEKLDHLKDIGVQATWLSPIMKSPQADHGYDISDFKDIDKIFGTIEDFERLTTEAKARGIKIIMDFVPNHSSDEHDWFVKSEDRDPEYEDYYVWVDGKDCIPQPWDPEGPVPCKPPNNWNSVFYGSAWSWNWKREQFYLHQFDKKQPDLNYRNPRVVEEMKDVLRFWLDKGASGFRVDAVNHMFEVEDLRDEPPSGNSDDPLEHSYLHHWYTQDLDEMYDMVRQWSDLLADYTEAQGDGETRVMMIEAWANETFTARYYTDSKANFPFNFKFINRLNNNGNAYSIRDTINAFLDYVPEGSVPNWVLGNHDVRRVASRFDNDRVDGLLAIEMTLPGVAVTYNGEEIGMVDWRNISWEDSQDPQACNGPREGYLERSRDPQRTPFQWDSSVNAGFNTGEKPWLPVHPNYVRNNLEAQKGMARSYYSFYKELAELRTNPILTHGSLKMFIFDDFIYSHIRSFEGQDIITVVNWSYEWRTIDLSRAVRSISDEVEIVVVGHRSSYAKGAILKSRNLQVRAYDALVLRPRP